MSRLTSEIQNYLGYRVRGTFFSRTECIGLVFKVLVFILLAFPISNTGNAFAQTVSCPKTQVQEWTEEESDGISIKVACNSFYQGRFFTERNIFILLAEQHFNQANLQKLFARLATINNHPDDLSITAFSDSEMLISAINEKSRTFSVAFPNTPSGRAAEIKWHEEHGPRPTGYFRAYYRRSEEEESFRYSPEKEKRGYVTVILKTKTLSNSGKE